MSPQNPRIPPQPFANPELHNREVAARRAAEAAAGRAEAEMLARKAFQAMPQTAPRGNDLPPGFRAPPAPQVGERTEGQYPNGKMPVMPPQPPPDTMEALRNRMQEDAALLEEAERMAAAEQQQLKQAPVRPRPVVQKAPAVSPILQQLRLDLGIDTQKTIDLTVADHIWSFYPLSPEMTTLALRIADMAAVADTERQLLQQYAAVCCSIVAIDHEPIWKVFSLEPEKDDDLSVPLMPRGRLRQRAALSLLQELMTNSKLGVMQSLIEAYNAEVDPQGVVKGYTEYTNDSYCRWSCNEPGCQFSIVRPKRFNGNNQMLAYYCEVHGSVLADQPLSSIKEGLNPLV